MGFAALLGFAPFAAFALIEKLIGIVPGLVAGLSISLALMAWEVIRHHRGINILEAGSAVIFAGLTVAALTMSKAWAVWEVRLYVDAGLAFIVFLSVLLRRPFTLQTARRTAPAEVVRGRDFLRHNNWLSCVWGLAFAGLAAIDLFMTAYPETPDRRGILLTLAVLATAAKVTQHSVKRIRRAG